MEEVVIRIYGDSLALPRHQDGVAGSQVYAELLAQMLRTQHPDITFTTYNRSIGGATVRELYQAFLRDNGYFGNAPSILIIQSGVVDCAPRPIPTWLRKVIGKLPGPIKKRVIKFLHDHRATLLNKGFRFTMTSKDRYASCLREWTQSASAMRVIVVNIAPTNVETEAHSPGFGASIQKYNLAISQLGGTALLVDIHKAIAEAGVEELMLSDGHHLSSKAHKLYAQSISDTLSKSGPFLL